MAQERGYRAYVEFGPTMATSGMEKNVFGAALYTSHGY